MKVKQVTGYQSTEQDLVKNICFVIYSTLSEECTILIFIFSVLKSNNWQQCLLQLEEQFDKCTSMAQIKDKITEFQIKNISYTVVAEEIYFQVYLVRLETFNKD